MPGSLLLIQIAPIGLGAAAKIACSNIFISGRSAARVLEQELGAARDEYPSVLKWIDLATGRLGYSSNISTHELLAFMEQLIDALPAERRESDPV